MVRSLEMTQTLLRPEEVDDLVAQYRKHTTLVELASRFGGISAQWLPIGLVER